MDPALREALAGMPRLGFGGAVIGNLYREVDDAAARAAVDAAWENGLRHYDTAPHYGLGLSERRLGEALRDRPRNEFVLSTKVGRLLRPRVPAVARDDEGFAVPGDIGRVRDYSGDGVRRSIEESLQRLGLDRIDIAYIHDPDEYWEDALRGAVPALEKLRDEGVIGAWGAGMNQAEMLTRFARETDIDVIMCAGRYSLLDQHADRELLPAAAERGIAVMAVGVFNSGILAKPRPPATATYNYEQAPVELLQRANELAELAESHGTTLPAVAVHFALRHPAVTHIHLGMRTPDQVMSSVSLVREEVPEAFYADAVAAGLLAPPNPAPPG